MSILPGIPTTRPVSSAAEVNRIARLAAALLAAPVAWVQAFDTLGEHRDPATTDVPLDGPARCAETVATGRTHSAMDHPTASYVCVPLPAHGTDETPGAICVAAPGPRTWTEAQLAGLTDLAALAAAGSALRDSVAGREQAHAEHAFLNAVLGHLTDGVAACDRDGKLVYFNPALREIHGLPERTLDATDWATAYDLYAPDGIRLLRPDEIPLARAFAGETVQNQHMVVQVANRDPQHFLVTGAPITDADGGKLGAVVSMHDVTADHRRRRIRAAHLAIATALSDNPGGDAAIATAMLHLREALDPLAADVVKIGDTPDHDIDARVVRAVSRSGRPMQAALAAPFAGYVGCAPIVVSGTTVGVIYLAGRSANLLDDLAGSVIEGAAALLGRCLERERSDRLDRELRATRHDLERVIRHAQDFVWSIEFLPSGRMSLRTTTTPEGILGGGPTPDEDGWLELLETRVDPQDMTELLRWRDDVRRGRPGEFTCRLRGADGLVRWIRTRCAVRSEDGRRYVDGVSSDVTGQTRFELVRDAAPALNGLSGR